MENIYLTDTIKNQIINTLHLASWTRSNIPNYQQYIKDQKVQLQQKLLGEKFLLSDLCNIVAEYSVDLFEIVNECYESARLANKDFSTLSIDDTYVDIQYVPDKHDQILYDLWTYPDEEYIFKDQSLQYGIEQTQDLLHWCGYVEVPYYHNMYKLKKSDIYGLNRYTKYKISDMEEESEFINKIYIIGKLNHGYYFISKSGNWCWSYNEIKHPDINNGAIYHSFNTIKQALQNLIQASEEVYPYRYCATCSECETNTQLTVCTLCKITLYCSDNCRLKDVIHVDKCTKWYNN